jgi:hypothetical protein
MKLWLVILIGVGVGGIIGSVIGQYYQFNVAYGRSMNTEDINQKCYGILQKTQDIDERGDYVCFNDPIEEGGICHICETDYSGKAQYVCWGKNPDAITSYIYKNQIIGRLVWVWCI